MNYRLISTRQFKKWFDGLGDQSTKSRLLTRLVRLENGQFGDYRRLTENLYELKMRFGGGLRIYFAVRESDIIVLLVGGNKSSQSHDIVRAQQILKSVES